MTGKFRIFINGEFYYYGWIENAGLSWVSPPTQGDMSPQEVRENSEASTGLKDRKGTEIFAGDIVKYKDMIGEIWWQPSGAYFAIDWKPGRVYTKTKDWPKMSNSTFFEIIGNIYDNPELLK